MDQVPDAVTVEYVQRVMDALDHVEGNLIRKLVKDRTLSVEVRQMLTALYGEPAFSKAEAGFGQDAASGFDAYLPAPGDPSSHANVVITSSPKCIVANVDRDLGPERKQRSSADTIHGIVILRPKNPERDPLHLNPTAWSITAEGEPSASPDLTRGCD